MSRLVRALAFVIATSIFSIAYGSTASWTIDNYPRYGTEPTTAQREELRRVANDIAWSVLGGANVVVMTVGHADFDANGRSFEIDVSRKRALGAETLLKRLLEEEFATSGRPTSGLRCITFQLNGKGTAEPVFQNPRSEDERMANRRVEFLVTKIGFSNCPGPAD